MNLFGFFRKPKLEGAVKEHIQQANIDENHAEKILDGKDMDAFNRLVSSVAHKLKKPLEEIKSDFSVNRRRVKNRSSAKNSRIGRNSRLENSYEIKKLKLARLERKKLLTAMIPVSTGNLKITQIFAYYITYLYLLDLSFQYVIFKISCAEREGAIAKIQATFRSMASGSRKTK